MSFQPGPIALELLALSTGFSSSCWVSFQFQNYRTFLVSHCALSPAPLRNRIPPYHHLNGGVRQLPLNKHDRCQITWLVRTTCPDCLVESCGRPMERWPELSRRGVRGGPVTLPDAIPRCLPVEGLVAPDRADPAAVGEPARTPRPTASSTQLPR